jgi:MFS family permease
MISGAYGRGALDRPWPSAWAAWYAVGVLSCVYVVSFVDRHLLSLIVAPLRRDLALSDTDVSLLQGFSFSLFYSALALPLGRMADRSSRRRLIAAGMLVWCCMTVACGLARTYAELFVARMGVGVGEAALTPAALSIISDCFPISLGAGLAYIGGGSAVAYATALPEQVLPLVGRARPWQLAFVVTGGAGLLLLPAVWSLREPARATGLIFGAVLMTAGVAGPLAAAVLCVRLRARGRDDATLRVAWIAALAALPFALLWPIAPSAAACIALLAAGMRCARRSRRPTCLS